MSKAGLKINPRVHTDKSLIERFYDFPVANVGDAMNRLAAIDSNIRPFNETKLLGPAFTIRVPEGDNLMLHKAMDLAEAGDIIVIDAGGSTQRAILGELILSYCQIRGISGVLLDGCVRDVNAIKEMDIAVYAKGVSPNGPYKNGPGEINVPVVIGGKIVNPGDIIIGDADGVIIIKPEDAETIIKETLAINKKETKIMEEISNKGTYTRPWVDKKLKELSYEF